MWHGLDKHREMSYIVYMVKYADDIAKRVVKGAIQGDVFLHINNAFTAMDVTKDLKLFDVKQLKVSKETGLVYYRLRKGKYRAIFHTENGDIMVVALDKREDVYRRWQ